MSQPYVGQLLSYYPDEETRWAAICVEAKPSNDGETTLANLQVFNPDGKVIFKADVKQAAQGEDEEEARLGDRWSFLHEFYVDITDREEEIGTNTNEHVGVVSTDSSY